MVEVFDGLWQAAWGVRAGDSSLYGHTASYGISFNGGLGAGVTLGLQALAVDVDGNMAFLAIQKGGMGTTGGIASMSAWRQMTNAPTVDYPLNGVTVFVGGSGAVGVGAGIDVVIVGRDSSGRPYLGAQGSIELGAAASPLTAAEFHGGAYHTGEPFWQVNIYDLLGYLRPSQR